MRSRTQSPQRGGSSSLAPANLRACERVIHYLMAEFENPELKTGSRLPTNCELARRLRVSVPTVKNAMRKLTHEGRVRTRRGSGTYLVSKSPSTRQELRIAVGMLLNTSAGPWFVPIAGGMLRAALCMRKPIAMVGFNPEDRGSMTGTAGLLAQRDQMAGAILLPQLLPAGWDEEVIAAYERVGKPVVHLNPPTISATANFVSADFFGASRLLGRAWRKTGRRRVLLLVGQRMKDSVSAQLRQSGLIQGLRAGLGDSATVQVVDEATYGEETCYEAMRKILTGSVAPPDALYCTGDFMALGALRAIQEHGLEVPKDVSVIGGSGVDLSAASCPDLTRTRQPLEELGRHLIEMLCKRIEQHGASLPGLFLPTPFLGGATTRPEENELLDLTTKPAADARVRTTPRSEVAIGHNPVGMV